MAVKSAKNGTATWEGSPIDDVTNIVVNENPDPKVYSSSSTGGQKKRVAGVSDVTGSFDVKSDSITPTPGSFGTLVLTSDGSVQLFSGRVMIGEIVTNCNIETGDIVSKTVNFGRSAA